MKRVLFAVFALFVMAGYMFAQNEAYLEQVGGSHYGTAGVTINQQGDGNKLFGTFGSVPGHTDGAAYMRAERNILNIYQVGGNGEAKLRMDTRGILGTSNSGTVQQWGNGDVAVIDQLGTQDNVASILQNDKGTAELTQSTLLGSNYGTIYQKGGLTNATRNMVKISQTTASGNNEVFTTLFAAKFEGADWQHAGIVQMGDDNLIKGFGGDVATQTSTVSGNNHFSALQYGNTNTISFNQSASGNNSADFYQHGDKQIISVNQVGPTSNTAIISQAF